ncbi:SubName: Full=Uncharacterized protein {ECO:0000313/EMBL:CCA67777.1} [Serendipita indica DSM 11827]|nr:SubName: Full=Uncharacterized protein {ECO:0000313/EMBL:CCA67777.1} [Serendipita indica DSM 11827]
MAKPIRGLHAALNASGRYKFRSPDFEVDHLIIGGGVVGLAIARELSLKRPHKSTYLVERHTRTGEETSSRNSEVIHGGFYYPENSYKTRLCLMGRRLLYDYCDSHAVPYKKTGKLVVGHEHQRNYLENLYQKTQSLRWPAVLEKDTDLPQGNNLAVPARLLTGNEARGLEPDLSRDIACALLSTETGIIDVHTYMEALEKDISESEAGSVVCSTNVVRVDPTKDGWVVQMSTSPEDSEGGGQTDSVLAKTLINSSGLSAPFILNALGRGADPPLADIPIYYARGSYASYRGPGVTNVKHLIYPVPNIGVNKHGFAGLGTHLTLDLGGNIKFGPDIEWIEPPKSTSDEEAIDFWIDHLVASDDTSSMFQSVRSYLPGIEKSV